ncbi:hypothetical protein [Holophaga foetida]|uniref:hypothetical protein n=1 Tax=Holophaga foetida TaxID=35839 RepID=UPI0002472ADA|nr:hypothetical protein [Holophaga foetida]
MTRITALENANISLWYYPDTKVVHHQIHKYTSGAPLREANEKGIELLQKHGACKWLSDDRNNGPLPPEDLAWAHDSWTPRAIKAGWKFWALVVPEKAVAQMNMKRFQAEFAQAGVTVQAFTDPEAAMAWLVKQ